VTAGRLAGRHRDIPLRPGMAELGSAPRPDRRWSSSGPVPGAGRVAV